MKKLASTWYNMTIVLTLISVVAGAALAYVNDLTAGPIRMIKEQELQDGIKAVLSADDLTVESTDEADGVIVYRTDKGTAVQATDPNGFGGKLTVLVGFDSKGAVQGYRVLESAETPGLGAKCATDTKFMQQWQGFNPGEKILSVKKDGGDVDAITASTITSRAYTRAVALAVAAAEAAAAGEAADAVSGASLPQTEEGGQDNE